MDTIIRTYVPNEERFELLLRSIASWHDKQLFDLGSLIIADDLSPIKYAEKVKRFCLDNKIEYGYANFGIPDTKNGLYWSFKMAKSFPVLCCVDDLVFGKKIKEKIIEIQTNCIPILENDNIPWACIGMFSCYQRNVRTFYKSSGLWNIPNDALYALVCHIFSEPISKILNTQWEKFILQQEPISETENFNLNCCDDLWVSRNASTYGFKCFNTYEYDYAQHTGMSNRSFNVDTIGNSNYMSPCFIGE